MITSQKFFDSKIKLPSPPAIALRILQAVRDDENSFDKLAEIIKSDPVLAAQTLKLANSSIYGVPKRIDSLSRAISLIGTQALKNIALSFIIIDDFLDRPQGSFNLDLFWRRAITAAVSAETLASVTAHKDPDIFITSLLQDIGILILFLSYTVSYTEVLDKKRISGQSTAEVEREKFGFDHTEVGYELFKSWNLPESITEPIRYHHHKPPETTYSEAINILNIADKISSIYHGTRSNLKSKEVYQKLKGDYGLENSQTAELIDTIGEKSVELLELYSIDPGEMKPFSQIMLDANDELGKLNYSYEQIVLELTQAKQNAEQLAINLKEANDKLRELTFRDGLTGLYNHMYFQDFFENEIQKSIRYKTPVSLLLLDIDHFKSINDRYGHPTGDHVLIEASKVLVKLVRHCDIVARYGGEEFAIVLPETGTVGAKVLAQRLRRGIEQQQFQYDKNTITITMSVGISSTDMNSIEISRKNLISKSDQALYTAKQEGRNRVVVSTQNPKVALCTGTDR